MQGVTRRCRLAWLTNCALDPKCGGGGVAGSQPMSIAVQRSPNKIWRSNSILTYDITKWCIKKEGRLSWFTILLQGRLYIGIRALLVKNNSMNCLDRSPIPGGGRSLHEENLNLRRLEEGEGRVSTL